MKISKIPKGVAVGSHTLDGDGPILIQLTEDEADKLLIALENYDNAQGLTPELRPLQEELPYILEQTGN